MLVTTYGSAVFGMEARAITVEVSVTAGLHYFIVGLADGAVRESLRRIESAIKSNGWNMPRTKIVVNLAPAGLRKTGTAFDLPIALGVLGASGQIKDPERLRQYTIMGELSLDGALRPIQGVLVIAEQVAREGRGLILPAENAAEAALVEGLSVYGVSSLREVVDVVCEGGASRFRVPGSAARPGDRATAPSRTVIGGAAVGGAPFGSAAAESALDFRHVSGQAHAKRALEIAAAGSHNVLLVGPPGTGKTLLARLLPGILPPLTRAEAIEVTRIYSVAGKINPGSGLIAMRPFRSPHHSSSATSLVGGGAPPLPGEVSLAHNGVLFLDELPEFPRMSLEYLRQPLEDRSVNVSRVTGNLSFPASFMLVAAMNPCPCGYRGHPDKNCTCPATLVGRYWQRLSGPLLDRIDLQVEVGPVSYAEMDAAPETLPGAVTSTAYVRARVAAARARQSERFAAHPGLYANAHMHSAHLHRYCRLPAGAAGLLKNAVENLGLSARAFDRVRKIARTIADLDGCVVLKTEHVAEALQFRGLDRQR